MLSLGTAAVVVALAGLTAPASASSAHTTTVTLKHISFIKETVRIHAGDKVRWVWKGSNIHNVAIKKPGSSEVSIRSDWLTGEDLFLITEQVNPNGTIDFKAIINPLVNLIWAAGLIFLIGAAITLWPDAREERRLAVRYGRLPQEA